MSKRKRTGRSSAALGQLSLWSNDSTDEQWRVRVSDRARRMSIRVLAGGCVDIVVPPWMRARGIEQFVHKHRAWVERKVSEFSFRVRADALPDRIELAASGELWHVRLTGAARRPVVPHAGGATLTIRGDPRHVVQVRRHLRRWLIERARALLVPWLERLAAETGFTPGRVQIRRQRTRWGSCSPGGTISLNCCLLFQSPAVVRYLLLHELCHTRHMNHSRRFWRLVARHEPDFRRLDRALTHGWQNVPAWVFAP